MFFHGDILPPLLSKCCPNFPDHHNPRIQKDGVPCLSCNISSYINNTLIFTVPGFSTYSIIDTADTTPTTSTLNITMLGTGAGTISGTNISCTTACAKTITNTSLILTATPNTNSTFSGWSGGTCIGTTPCTFTSTADITVVATFTTNVVTPLPPVGGGGGGSSGGSSQGGGSTGGGSTGGGSRTVTITPVTPNIPAIQTSSMKPLPAYVTSLVYGKYSGNARSLQIFLNTNGYLVSTTGPGSKGQETNYFGPATLQALNRYKVAYASSISPNISLSNQNTVSLQITPITGTSTSRLPTTFRFTSTLTPYTTNINVKNLQIFLNDHGFTVSTKGIGSKGQESTYYGNATKSALIRFQEYYRSEILTPNGLTKGTGNFGASTRGKVNGMIK